VLSTVESVESTTGDLVCRAADGDPAAWAELVGLYERLVWTIARSHGLSVADAGDVAQCTWLNLAEQLPRLRDPNRLGGWLCTTARRESLRVQAMRRRETPVCWPDLPPEPDDPAVRVLGAEQNRLLWQAFADLPDRCRPLIRLLAETPRLDHTRAADELGIARSSVGRLRERCVAEYRRLLAQAGFQP
jgi:RNA polymerase sigma factor (sigma-70 family)